MSHLESYEILTSQRLGLTLEEFAQFTDAEILELSRARLAQDRTRLDTILDDPDTSLDKPLTPEPTESPETPEPPEPPKTWACCLCFKQHEESADLRCTTPGKEGRDFATKDGTTYEQRRRAMLAKEKAKAKPTSSNVLVIKAMGSVTTKKINWLWDQHIPQGKLTIFCGDPGSMKSMVAGDIAARGSVGAVMPDGTTCPAFDTLMFVGEDDVDDTTVPRLLAAAGDANRVHYVEGIPSLDGEMQDVALDEHIGLIRKWLAENPKTRAVVVDPLSNYLGDVKMIDEQTIRRKILTPLKRLAAETGVAIIGVMHLNKKVQLSAINRIGGAMAFVGVARMVWLFIGDSQDPNKRYMLKVKSNIVKTTTGQAFEVVEKAIPIDGEMIPQPVINWTGTTSQNVNQQLGNTGKDGGSMAGTTADGVRAERIPPSTKWLKSFLADGLEHPLADLLKAARLDAGYARSTVYRAKVDIDRRAYMGHPGWLKIEVREESDEKGASAFWKFADFGKAPDMPEVGF
jgi:putative DNA primase/helicase